MNEDSLENPPNRQDHEAAHGQKLQEYYHAIRERLWIILLCLVLGGIYGAIRVSMREPQFQARSVLFLEQEQNKVLSNVKDVRDEQVGSLDMINTVVDLLDSYSFAERVEKRLAWNNTQNKPANDSDIPTADKLQSMVSARYRKATRLIDIFVSSPNAAFAVTLANAYADEYLRYVFERRSEASKNARQYLVEEAERLRGKMRISEEAMQSFRQREGAASPETQQTTIESKVLDGNAQISALEAKIFQLDSDLTVARSNAGNFDELLRLPSVASEPNVARLTAAVVEQERVLLLLSQRYRPAHPTYIANQTQLNSLLTERNVTLTNVISLLETSRVHLQAQLVELQKSKTNREQELLSVTGKSVEFNDLKREFETDRTMYDSVLGRMKEIDMTTGFTSSPVNIQERAIGAASLSESAVKIYATNILMGIAAGIAIVLFIHSLDSTIKTVEMAEQVTGLTVISAVPRKTGSNRSKSESLIDSIADRRGLIAESFRSLRASIAMLSFSDTKRIFLFTSAVPSEGKTFCSSNFAVTLAQQGLKTLLIDTDLRKPGLAKVFFKNYRGPGLADVLAGAISMDQAISPSEIEGLSILTAGNRAPNPAELLGTARLRELINEALLTYDRVVLDTAPCLAVSDAFLVAPLAEVHCLVLRSSSTPKKTAIRAIRALEDIKCKPVGIILNFLPTGDHYYYYSGRYFGSYGAKGVYGSNA